MIGTALVLAALSALLHVYIFVMESVTWTSEKTRATFGISLDDAEATKEMAFNQGFYNLFLAIVAAIGIVFVIAGERQTGAALIFAGVGSMLAAAAVLLITSPDKRSAAIKQGLFPLLTMIVLLIAMI